MAVGAGEAAQAIEEIAGISEENSAAAEEVSATVKEVSAQAEEVTASAQSLSEMAQELQTLVAQFRLPAGVALALSKAAGGVGEPVAISSVPVAAAKVVTAGDDGYENKKLPSVASD